MIVGIVLSIVILGFVAGFSFYISNGLTSRIERFKHEIDDIVSSKDFSKKSQVVLLMR